MIPNSLSTIIREAVRSEMLNLHTAMPGTIISFDPVKQVVEVQLDLKFRRSVSGSYVDEPIAPLKDVPIVYPRANNYSLTMPIVPGDTCEVRFMERSIDNWLIEGGTVSPEDYRHHALSDAVCFVGMWDRTNLISNYNAKQPEFRTGDGTRKVWLDDTDAGHVEMVDTVQNTRVVLKANGEARVANDKVNTFMEIFPDTKIQLKNPLAKTRIDKDGDILLKNPLTSRRMDKGGDITDKTILAKQFIKKNGVRLFKNVLISKIDDNRGQIVAKSLLSKFKMGPDGKMQMGNPFNKMTMSSLAAEFGAPTASFKAIGSLGKAIVSDGTGAITPMMVMSIIGAVTAIADFLGLDIMKDITSELDLVKQILDGQPLDDFSVEKIKDTITDLLVEEGIDILSQEAGEILAQADLLDGEYNQEILESMTVSIENAITDVREGDENG